jgi:hypothetical protein
MRNEKGYKPFNINPPLPEENWPYHHHPVHPNDRQFTYKAPKFERHVFIRKDQVFFDLDSQLAILSLARKKQDGTEDESLSNATTAYRQMFYRWIDKHIGIAKGVMSAFVLDRFKTTSMNSISDKDEIDIELLMPEFWDDTVFDQLTNAVHDYVVNATLYEYFTISLTSKDPVTVDKRQLMIEALSDVKKYVNAAKPGFIHKIKSPL